MADEGNIPGNAPNQFAQVGMGGSLGGGQFEQGDGQSGSLQDQQGGTTTTRSVPLSEGADADGAGSMQDGGQQEQDAGVRSSDDEDDGGTDGGLSDAEG